ncbi:MAG: flagellar basal body P-ring protein FlgI [Planctomycetota bacterium]|jgi:flagellar P-ring protein precursor FlgI
MKSTAIYPLTALLALCWAMTAPVAAGTKLKHVCRVEGQEETTLRGLGLVTGLKGTGDGANSLPTIQALARIMELMGQAVGPDGVKGLKDAKNVALVMVTATIPAAGARRGDKLDCTVQAISAKSLAGGYLSSTPLTGPLPSRDLPVYALAEGPITLDGEEMITTGRLHEGCRLLEDFVNPLPTDGKMMLVVRKEYADFKVAQVIASQINRELGFASDKADESGSAQEPFGFDGVQRIEQARSAEVARALDQVNVEVSIPAAYSNAVAEFASEILEMELREAPQVGPRVVIHERTGSIVIDGDVEIGPVVFTHKNNLVATGVEASGSQFVPLDPQSPENPKLQSLLAALKAIRVPNEDIIDIIKTVHQAGRLYAELIIQ